MPAEKFVHDFVKEAGSDAAGTKPPGGRDGAGGPAGGGRVSDRYEHCHADTHGNGAKGCG